MMTEIIDSKKEYTRAVCAAADLIRRGEIVAFPTETVYGLGGDAMNPEAIQKIFAAKGRPSDNPLIVHISEIDQSSELACEISPLARQLMDAFWPGPFTVVLKKKLCVPDCVTGGLATVAIRLPDCRIARDIIAASGRFVAAPSANISGRPSPTCAAHVMNDFNGEISLIIDGGACEVGVESTVCDLTGEIPIVLRPGGVTPEMIRSVAGNVFVHSAVLGELEGGIAPSPGMKYKHYAPSAEIIVVEGQKKDVAKRINAMYYEIKCKCAILCTHEDSVYYSGKNVIDLGTGNNKSAKNLFAALRNMDEMGLEKVLFHAVETNEMGLAIMNRMIRAAGHKVITVAKEDEID